MFDLLHSVYWSIPTASALSNGEIWAILADMTVKSSQSTLYSGRSGPLGPALAALRAAGVAPKAGPLLARTADQAAASLRQTLLEEIPAFRASGNPDILPEVGRHAGEHVKELTRLFGGEAEGDFAFVKVQAHARAEQHFPLEAMLHSYRSGHRLLAHWLREAAIAAKPKSIDSAVAAVADFAIEYTNAISAIATSEYVAHTRRLAEAAGDLKNELLSILLAGYDESDLRIAQLLKRAGYLEQRQSYCLVLVQSAQAAEMARAPRAERILAALNDALADLSVRALAGIRQHRVVAVLSARRRQSGWTAAQADLAERLYPKLMTLGPAVVIGVSADHPSTAFIPKAMTEAALALDLASVGRRVVRFCELSLRDLLVHHGAQHLHATPPAWIAPLIAADQKADGQLVATLRALADADMNVQKAARRLGRHPNTLTLRLERIRDLTGRHGGRYHQLEELLLAVECFSRPAMTPWSLALGTLPAARQQ